MGAGSGGSEAPSLALVVGWDSLGGTGGITVMADSSRDMGFLPPPGAEKFGVFYKNPLFIRTPLITPTFLYGGGVL